MKKIFTSIVFFCVVLIVLAQPPEKISFQAVVRNAEGELLKSTPIGFRIQVLMTNEFGAAVFVETQQVTTNENGLAMLQIGNGTAVTGKLEDVDWAKGPYYLKTEMDPAGGTNYSLTGTQQILSVPYALYAKNAAMPENIVKSDSVPVKGNVLYFDGTGWKPVSPGTDGQVLTMADGIPQWKNPVTGNEIIELHEPVLTTSFPDNNITHLIHLATDGNYYYTCNGGNYTNGNINKYTLSGDFIKAYPIAIDMRGLMYNKADGNFYVSGFEASTAERNIYKITSLDNGTFTKILPNSYDYYQSTTAISDDGEFYYAFYNGVLKKYKLSDGTLVDTFENIESGSLNGSNGAVAVDDQYFYTWDPATGTIHVYKLDGSFEKNLKIPVGNFGYSLSYAAGYLFVSIDGVPGTWYGYNIRKMINPAKITPVEAKIQSSQSRVPNGPDTVIP
ncbi:MAG TPA: hypothetical protein VK179_05295 [Bacteroidales bacterium]|nr:hypothetical protein [Bacteroidales bacterium]